jgi:threonylcarbamoyladenosine tRNA methylthiotransferase MtaB
MYTPHVTRAAFTTLGCKVNQYETQRILDSFENAGFRIVPFESEADVYVINTCSVTSVAESKSRYTIRRATRANPDAKVVVTGCAAQMSLNKNEAMEGADVVVPNPDKLETLRWLYRTFPGLERQVALDPAPRGSRETAGRTRATLKVQDGCSVFCSYCSIPHTRPGMRSRPWQEVLDEAGQMVEMGFKEIVLTGVLIGAYGPQTGSGGPDFEELIERLSGVRGLERIRISSIEMRQVTPRLLGVMKATQVVSHLHIPLQSGDTDVLRDMNRPYTQEDYLNLCGRLYAEIPDIAITTDIMVGFPTESEARFASTLRVCEEAKYLKAHVFRFSPRFGTPADRWKDPVSDQEKQERSRRVSEIARQTGEAFARRFLGRTVRVLAESRHLQSGNLRGLSDNYLEVRFAGPQSLVNELCWVRLDECKDSTLFGEIAPAPASKRTPLRTFAE